MASGSNRLRASRWLLIVLTLAISTGLVVYLRESKRHRAAEARLAAMVDGSVKSPALLDPKAAPLLSGGPPALPAIKLAGVAGSGDPQKPKDSNPKDGNPNGNPKDGAVAASAQQPARPAVAAKPAGTASKLLSDAKVKSDAGDLVAARTLLNEPLVSGQLVDADADAVRHALSDLNQKLIFSAKPYAGDPFEETFPVEQGMRLQKVANHYDVTWPLLCRVNGYEPTDAGARRIRSGQTLKAIKGPFFAVVTKSAFRMDLYLGGLPGEANATYVSSFPVGLGRDDSTPSGSWTVELHNKLRNPKYYSPRGEGVFAPEDPKNPLGGYWIGLKGEGGNAIGKNSYGIHGTIEPDSIGKQASMGCIRLRHDDIELVFEMLVEVKSRVLIQQ